MSTFVVQARVLLLLMYSWYKSYLTARIVSHVGSKAFGDLVARSSSPLSPSVCVSTEATSTLCIIT